MGEWRKLVNSLKSLSYFQVASAATIIFSVAAVHFWGYSWKLLGNLRILADVEFAQDFFSELLRDIVVSGIFARLCVMLLHLDNFVEISLFPYVFREEFWKRKSKLPGWRRPILSRRPALKRVYLRSLRRKTIFLQIIAFLILFFGIYVGYDSITRNFSVVALGAYLMLFSFYFLFVAVFYVNSLRFNVGSGYEKLLRKARSPNAVTPTILVFAITSLGISYLLGIVRAEVIKNEYAIDSIDGRGNGSFILGKTRNGVFVLSLNDEMSIVEFYPFSEVGVLRNQ
jgi:hypothetical protein